MEKVFITDKQGNKVLPKTHVSAVYDDEGNDLGSHLGAFEDEVRGLVDTPHQEYVTVSTYASLPQEGSADTIYRVSNYDGSQSQVAADVYSEYAWDGTQYVFLCVKSQIGEVFDISVYNNNAKYADLAAALNGGANIPQSLQKGGMSVKFVQSSDNKYVQLRLISDEFSTTETDWQGVDDEATSGSKNLIESGGAANATGYYSLSGVATDTYQWLRYGIKIPIGSRIINTGDIPIFIYGSPNDESSVVLLEAGEEIITEFVVESLRSRTFLGEWSIDCYTTEFTKRIFDSDRHIKNSIHIREEYTSNDCETPCWYVVENDKLVKTSRILNTMAIKIPVFYGDICKMDNYIAVNGVQYYTTDGLGNIIRSGAVVTDAGVISTTLEIRQDEKYLICQSARDTFRLNVNHKFPQKTVFQRIPQVTYAYITQDGIAKIANTYVSSDFIPVGDGLRVYYHGSGNSQTAAIYGYDIERNPIEIILPYQESVTSSYIDISAKYAFIRICSNATDYHFEVYSVSEQISIFGEPRIKSVTKIGDNTSRAKGACFRVKDYYVVTYGENLDGNVNDFPTQSGSGTLALKYKKFEVINGIETNISFGTIAQKGTNYLDINGDTQVMPGGCGLPSGTNRGGMQYFSTASSDGVYVPMCCTVSISSQNGSVTFGSIRQLSLTINGTKGDFDFSRINRRPPNTYYTTAAPYKNTSNNQWFWCQVISGGFAYLTSSNGYDWVLEKTFDLNIQPQSEISCIRTASALFASLRVKGNALNGNTDTTAVLVYVHRDDLSGDSVSTLRMYPMPALSARSMLNMVNNDTLIWLFNDYSGNSVSAYIVKDTLSPSLYRDGIHIKKWFELTNKTIWYASFCDTDIYGLVSGEVHIVGNNSMNETTSLNFGTLFLTLSDTEEYMIQSFKSEYHI